MTGGARASARRRSSTLPVLPALLYWYALYPLHSLVFAGMLEGIAVRASATAPNPPPLSEPQR